MYREILAAPSKVSIRIAQKFHKNPGGTFFDQPYKRIAYRTLLRGFSRAVDKSFF